jgi:glucan 1,3-beta-glucosidase
MSRPESSASMNPSDFATAPNTPGPATPLPDTNLSSHSHTPNQSNTHLPEIEVQDTPEEPQAPPASNPPTPRNVHTPLPVASDDDVPLQPPRASYFATSDASTGRNSYGPSSFNDSSQGLALKSEKPAETSAEEPPPSEKRSSIFKRPVFWLAVVIALIVLILIIILPVYFTVIKKHNHPSSAASTSGGGGGSPQSSGPSSPASPTNAITGGDGSTITTETGVNFTYKNQFGGFCECLSTEYSPCHHRIRSISLYLCARADISVVCNQGIPIPTIHLTTMPK